MNLIDWIIVIIILFAIINGFRQGIINSVVSFVGTLLILILAFYIKSPISTLLYEYFPFFNLGGKFAGITVFNILIYEVISYVITISVLSIILKVVTKVTGVVNKLLNATLILGFPSKILGAIMGFFQGYIIAFIVIFVLGLISGTTSKVQNSKYSHILMEKTPVLSHVVDDTYKSVKEVYDIAIENERNSNKEEANLQSLDVLLKYEILSVQSANKLIDKKKITTPGASDVVEKYKERNDINGA